MKYIRNKNCLSFVSIRNLPTILLWGPSCSYFLFSPLCFCFICHRSVSCTRCFLCICLDCQFLNTPSGFPNINLQSYQHLPSDWSCISELGVLICFPVKSAPSQIGSSQIGPSQIDPNSNRPQVKSAPSQIGLKMKVISAQKNKNKKRINK